MGPLFVHDHCQCLVWLSLSANTQHTGDITWETSFQTFICQRKELLDFIIHGKVPDFDADNLKPFVCHVLHVLELAIR